MPIRKLKLVESTPLKRIAISKQDKLVLASLRTMLVQADADYALGSVGRSIQETDKWRLYLPSTLSMSCETPSVLVYDDAKVVKIQNNRANAVDYVREKLPGLGFRVASASPDAKFKVVAQHKTTGIKLSLFWGSDRASGFLGWELDFSKKYTPPV